MSRLTFRVRLTALYGALFLITGAAMLGLTYVLMTQALNNKKIDPAVLAGGPGSGPSAADQAMKDRLAAAEKDKKMAGLSPEDKASIQAKEDLANRVKNDLQRDTLRSLLTYGGGALGVVAVAGLGGGWAIAGRSIRPVKKITATARRVAERNLHERIALTGPRDELRELADTFDGMLERLDRAFDGQRRFVANASHELKTPLAINRTLIEVALAGPDASPELRRLGQTLLDVNARHERLIDGLLTLARSEQAVTDPVPVDLADVVRHVADSTDRNGLEMRVSAEPAPTTGDPMLLERLVDNLVRNAVRYNVAGGWVEVGTHVADGLVRLVVANTGPELPSYEIPTLFEPFRRLADRVGSAQGNGLGLSIVRSVALAHGGTASAAGRPGGGLVVEVTLPARES